MPNPNQFQNPDAPDFAPKFQPIRPSDVAEVKKSYGITREKFSKDTSDKSIYDFSTRTVIDWFKRRKAEEAAAAAAAAAGTGGGGSGSGGGGAGGGGTAGTGPLPWGTGVQGSGGTGAGTKPLDRGITPAPPRPPTSASTPPLYTQQREGTYRPPVPAPTPAPTYRPPSSTLYKPPTRRITR